MRSSPDILWWVNSEYRKRLSRAAQYIALLEQLVLARAPNSAGAPAALLDLLEDTRRHLALLLQEHHDWRHAYYYQPSRPRRMVQANADIERALAQFEDMRAQHEQWLRWIVDVLARQPRPDPSLTHLPTGDLWLMTQHAIADLTHFMDQPDHIPPA